MIRLETFLVTVGCFLLGASFAFAGTDWDAANNAYHAGKYDEAKIDYLRLVQAGQYSPDLFYNLGNAWFKLGDPGRAILNYERALVLNPRLDEAQANRLSTLKLVGNEDAPTVRDRAGRYADYFVLTASIAFWIFAFALIFTFVKPRPVTRLCRIICVLAGLACGAGAGAAIWVGEGPKDPSRALVVDAKAELKYGPAISAHSAESLHIGNKVEILSERGDWTFCRASSGTLGWILTQKVERVIP
jgi:tetratricopeptide (TPR) repeat protein